MHQIISGPSKPVLILLLLTFNTLLLGCGTSKQISSTPPVPNQATQIIKFESITEGVTYTPGMELESPTLFVVGDLAEAAIFMEGFDDDQIKRIRNIDFKKTWVIAVFRGMMGNDGYGISVNTVILSPGEVRLIADFIDPAPGQFASSVISYPFHIIGLPRNEIQINADTVLTLYDSGGNKLAETKFP